MMKVARSGRAIIVVLASRSPGAAGRFVEGDLGISDSTVAAISCRRSRQRLQSNGINSCSAITSALKVWQLNAGGVSR